MRNSGMRGPGEFGVVDVHVVITEEGGPGVLLVGSDFEKLLEEWIGPEWIPSFVQILGEYAYSYQLEEFVRDSIEELQTDLRMRFHMHHLRRALRRKLSQAELERVVEILLNWRELHPPPEIQEEFKQLVGLERRSVYLGGFEYRGSRPRWRDQEVEIEWLSRWLYGCEEDMYRGGLTTERAEEIWQESLGAGLEARNRSLESLKRVLGEELTARLLRDGEIVVKSKNGGEYQIRKSGEVWARGPYSAWDPVCVRVDKERELPKYDVVLAKYLVIRDHPEQIETLVEGHERREAGREREMLAAEISCLHARLAELERRRRRTGGGG